MKIKKKQKANPEADKFGAEYSSIREKTQELANRRSVVTSAIFTLVEKKGVKEGKRTIIRGKRFVVGMIQPEPAPEIDYTKLKKLISPKLFKDLTVRQISPELVEQAIGDGRLSRDKLRKCLVKSSRIPSPRLYVGKLDEGKEVPEMDA